MKTKIEGEDGNASLEAHRSLIAIRSMGWRWRRSGHTPKSTIAIVCSRRRHHFLY